MKNMNDKFRTISSTNGNSTTPDFPINPEPRSDDPDPDFIEMPKPGARRRNVEILFSMQTGLKGHGWKLGVESCDLEPTLGKETTLLEHARAIAEDAYRENFDPIESLHDKHRHEEFLRDLAESNDAKLALLNERSKLKAAESAAAKALARVPKRPEFPVAVVAVSIPLITLTVAFTLYESFIASLGFILSLTFSLLAGLCWGAFISYLILHEYHSDENDSRLYNRIAVLAGIGMAVSLGFIRYSQSSSEFLLLVLGLTLLEVFIVIGMEFFATRYRRALHEHSQKATEAAEGQGEVESINSEIKRRLDRVGELQDKVEEHLQYLDERELRANHKGEFVASAEKAVIDGYRSACAYNKGKLLQ